MTERKIKALILQNEQSNDTQRWEYACEKNKETLDYTSIDLTRHDWLEKINLFLPDIILTKPGAISGVFKNLYDERLTILSRDLGYFCFPTLNEVLIYENKRYLSYFLKASGLPHPQTFVFYHKREALHFLHETRFPLIGKTNIGASGSGISILRNIQEAEAYVHAVLSGKGFSRRSGPNLEKGDLFRRGLRYFYHPGKIFNKLQKYRSVAGDLHKDFVILQEFISHDYEWRVVRMGDSFFAHKKVKKGEKASGALIKGYEDPPRALLTFVKDVTDRFGFYSQAVDIFESGGKYLINEMQCIFGQSDPWQMLVDNKPGRYVFKNNKWIFEEGDFNTNESYDLRLETAIELFKKQKNKVT